MFEDSLVESTGRIRTRSRWFAIGSFLFQAALLAVLVLLPYLYPAALPKQALTHLFLAPPPPAMHAEVAARVVVVRAASQVMLAALTAPSVIPANAVLNLRDEGAPQAIGVVGDGPGTGVPGALFEEGASSPRPVVVQSKPRGPVRISSGVAAGQLLSPIRPVYPAIARSAHIQGTVVVEATISKDGRVENARVVSGPAMLAQAALSAIQEARYLPYKLSGEPVEVETTIQVVFRMNE